MKKVNLREKLNMIDNHWHQRIVAPKGTEHRPVAPNKVEVAVIEPAGTLNTGNLTTDRTRIDVERGRE